MWGLILAGCGVALVVVCQTKSFRLKLPLVLLLIVGMVASIVQLPMSNVPDDEACGSGYLSREC